MDLITKNLLSGFVKEYDLDSLLESDQFERFSAFSMIRRHYSRNFDVGDVTMGGGGDTAIDALAIIVNNVLITDADTVDELVEQNGQLDVSFIFIQAKRTSAFDASKIGDFGFGVRDFFNPDPKIRRNAEIQTVAALATKIFAHAAILRGRPSCQLYYVTTGKWLNDKDLVARRDAVIEDLGFLSTFGSIKFGCVDAEELRGAYSQTKNAVTRVFEFKNRNDLPVAEGINQAFIGYVPFFSIPQNHQR